jgi:patatin-like phospholipase/acyl hydrolase
VGEQPRTIVALKGGGARGLVQARLGARLDRTHEGFAHRADLLAGASVGGIVAMAIAAGRPWRVVVDLFRNRLRRVFRDSAWDNILDLDLAGIAVRGAQYSSEGLKDVLEEEFADLRLGELKQEVLIPTLDLDDPDRSPRSWRPKFFSRAHDPNERVVDVGMRTSAAPTYFPTYQGYADGGLVANDPTVCALGFAVDQWGPEVLASVRVLTLGTGQSPKRIEGEDGKDWGALRWARHLLDAVMDGGLMAPLYQSTKFLGPRHHHLSPWLPKELPLDGDAWKGQVHLEENLALLQRLADEADLEEAKAWLSLHWKGAA